VFDTLDRNVPLSSNIQTAYLAHSASYSVSDMSVPVSEVARLWN
jgi:hypothetical protein